MTITRKFLGCKVSSLQKSLLRIGLSDNKETLDLYLEMEMLQEAPKSSNFIPLSEHQSATPASFYSGPPVLHYHSDRCKVVILERDLNTSPALTALARQAQEAPASAEPVTNGDGNHAEVDDDDVVRWKVINNVDVWVTSEYGRLVYVMSALVLTIAKQTFPLLCGSFNRPLNTISVHLPSCNPNVT